MCTVDKKHPARYPNIELKLINAESVNELLVTQFISLLAS